jgi:hypothetical protein
VAGVRADAGAGERNVTAAGGAGEEHTFERRCTQDAAMQAGRG